jgi:L,D-peptidoglycan transpeptidase YkuD (ErfK/YbiS/YcfS/YnhG family)
MASQGTRILSRTALTLLLLALACASCAAKPRPLGGADMTGPARQLLLVTAENWDSTSGELRRYERAEADSEWTAVGRPLFVNLGRSGLGWGRGLHGVALGPGPVKREGDGRAPAGLFELGTGFAYDPAEAGSLRLPLLKADADLLCVDGAESRFYNRIIDRRDVPTPDWSSVEDMLRKDDQYRLGLLVRHNMDPVVPGGGSCIFLHIWRGQGLASSGCTSMAPEAMLEVLRWLDAERAPVLAQMPRLELERYGASWRLPVPGE